MSDRILTTEPLTAAAFAPWGDVIEAAGAPDQMINNGAGRRFHDRARIDFTDGRAGISLIDSAPRALPLRIDMVERHPLGSQAFIPVDGTPMLVVVADDEGGKPVRLRAFLSQPGQGVNLHRGSWHGPLAPMGARGVYAVVDYIGGGNNLEVHTFDEAFVVEGIA